MPGERWSRENRSGTSFKAVTASEVYCGIRIMRVFGNRLVENGITVTDLFPGFTVKYSAFFVVSFFIDLSPFFV